MDLVWGRVTSLKREPFLFELGQRLFAIGLMLFMAASTALGIYGKLADRNAVMIVDVEPLRSIPTEVEAQAEKAYPPGSIARLEKSFLGWSKIRLPNQDAGWIRSDTHLCLCIREPPLELGFADLKFSWGGLGLILLGHGNRVEGRVLSGNSCCMMLEFLAADET